MHSGRTVREVRFVTVNEVAILTEMPRMTAYDVIHPGDVPAG